MNSMGFSLFKNTVLLLVFTMLSCGSQTKSETASNENENSSITNETLKHVSNTSMSVQDENLLVVAANQTDLYLELLKGKRVGIVANQTSVIFKNALVSSRASNTNSQSRYSHLVDSLVSLNVDVRKVFAPEHGFRGKADAGELIKNGVDTKTGIVIESIYGKNKKPSAEQLKDLDLVVFDIQDVGARFYTYISSLHYVMEACAEQNIPVLILDRPNPNGHYIDGPILDMKHTSFVGMHPIPVVHGMTIGEYAQMINGEAWLKNGAKCDITIIPIKNYTHDTAYNLPIKPSPNLPNDQSINLYPSLCFFEGTNVSAGRGTEQQFQIFGSPFLDTNNFKYQFTPQPNEGAKHPKHKNKVCFGMDLSGYKNIDYINLEWLIEAYTATKDKSTFFNDYFTTLAGTEELQKQIEQGYTFKKIRATWLKDLEAFKKMRRPYLIYQ